MHILPTVEYADLVITSSHKGYQKFIYFETIKRKYCCDIWEIVNVRI